MVSAPPRRAAIFPLPGAVIFPNTLLPLRVFEPRYVEMTRAVLAGEAPLAIAHLRPGYQNDYYGRPQVYSVATLTTIVEANELANGHYTMVVRGTERIRIEEELANDKAYREVLASIIDGSVTAREDDIAPLHEQIVALCSHLAVHLDEAAGLLMQIVRTIEEPATLSDMLASTLVGDPEKRQELLETTDVCDRMQILSDLLSEEIARIATTSGSSGLLN